MNVYYVQRDWWTSDWFQCDRGATHPVSTQTWHWFSNIVAECPEALWVAWGHRVRGRTPRWPAVAWNYPPGVCHLTPAASVTTEHRQPCRVSVLNSAGLQPPDLWWTAHLMSLWAPTSHRSPAGYLFILGLQSIKIFSSINLQKVIDINRLISINFLYLAEDQKLQNSTSGCCNLLWTEAKVWWCSTQTV